jgi:hypothetical protein
LKRFLTVLALAAIASPLAAHVGMPNTVFEGSAGPYPLRVIVKTPGVVPGLAEITVRTLTKDVTRVAVKPVKWDAGDAGSPPADLAAPVSGDPNLYAANLWLMARGSYSIYVDVEGTHGAGRAIVPVTNVATKLPPMPKSTGTVLLCFGALLAVGVVSIVGAGTREAVVEPGAEPDPSLRRKARIAMALTAALVALLLFRGNSWWASVHDELRRSIFKPMHITTAAANGTLDLRIDDPAWLATSKSAQRMTPLMPDHGKLMHLFLIEESTKQAFAHLHPLALSRDRFRAALPPLPPGRYRLFADVTHESGFAQTLVDRLTIPAAQPSRPPTDPDDSEQVGAPSAAIAYAGPEKLVANRDTDLRFRVAGNVEPYMGMLGHAVVLADDFSVFVHLHPMGSISMATQQKFLERDAKNQHAAAPLHEMATMQMPATDTISFPFTFPKPGHYRIWVQTRMHGQVVTGVFDRVVG